MRTFTAPGGTVFHYNGDFSGYTMIEFQFREPEPPTSDLPAFAADLPTSDLLAFAAEYVRAQRTHELEDDDWHRLLRATGSLPERR
jgi:hypothetical protein